MVRNNPYIVKELLFEKHRQHRQKHRLLRRLGMDAEGFIACADHFFQNFGSAVGWPRRGGCLRAAVRCSARRRP